MLNRVGLIVRQDDHVLPLVPIPLDKEGGDVMYIIDTASQFTVLPKVVDTNQQGLTLTGTVGVLESVATGSSMSKLLGT